MLYNHKGKPVAYSQSIPLGGQAANPGHLSKQGVSLHTIRRQMPLPHPFPPDLAANLHVWVDEVVQGPGTHTLRLGEPLHLLGVDVDVPHPLLPADTLTTQDHNVHCLLHFEKHVMLRDVHKDSVKLS